MSPVTLDGYSASPKKLWDSELAVIQQESENGDKFVKVSDDRYVPTLKAKRAAGENNIQPSF